MHGKKYIGNKIINKMLKRSIKLDQVFAETRCKMQPNRVPFYCFLLAINLLLAFLKAMGVPIEKHSVRMMFLAITFLPFVFLSVMEPETNLGHREGDFLLAETASSQAGPTQSHPRRFSIPLTVLYLASNYFTPTSFLWTLAIVLFLQRWEDSLSNCLRDLISSLAGALPSDRTDDIAVPLSETTQPTRPDDADLEANLQGGAAFRPAPTPNIDYTVQYSETTQPTRPNHADSEANPQGHATLQPVSTLNIDCTAQVSETTQQNRRDDSDREGNLQGEDTNNM